TNTSGYLELQMSIEAPPALASSPITIVFVIDASIIPAGQDQNSLQVFRNGTSVANCTVFDGTATPDPCVFSRELLSGGDAQGDVRLTIKTSAASTWNFAPGYAFRGFFGPVDNPPVWNTAKAGSVIPVRFSLTDYQGMEIFASGNPTSHARPCTPGTRDAIEEYVKGRSLTLTYDAGTDTYTYPWQTDKSWRGCRSLIVKLADGQSFSANFVFAK
ncbi:MAG TPA: PxKF domain-containing protein, partial [Candidatus Limnocylindrales bacterium]|nr:PxKF domain-containing protein [Candidatus Limnocylindrales bacterium]